jgi:type I restriction enzyme S subunit
MTESYPDPAQEPLLAREAPAGYEVLMDAQGVRPGYKLSEVGVIPEDWEVSTVGREFEIKLGKMLDAEKNAGVPKPYLGNKAVQWGRIDISELPTVPMSRSDIDRFRLKQGDLLVCEGGEVGRAAIWDAPIDECYYQKALHRLRPLHGFDSQLMAALLQQWSERGLLVNFVTQTSIAHLPREKFLAIPMAVPPLPEQRAIAAALSDVDALIAKLDQFIAKKRDLKQAAMQQLLTGQTRLPGFSGEWEVKPMRALGHTYGGLAGKTKADFGRGGARYIPFMNVMTDTVIDPNWIEHVDVASDEMQNLAKKGDLFFNGSSETPEEVGFCSVLLEEIPNLYLNSFCFGFRFNADVRVSGLFFAYWFRSKDGRMAMSVLAQGATRYNIAKSAFMRLEIPQPSAEEQTAIATVLSDMDAELAALEARRDKTRALKQGMMQELLTGRIRLA